MSLANGTRVGPYEIRSLIGAGGMGEVYLARDTTLHRDVALKILPGSVAADPDRIARFEREARTLAALNHPNIAHLYGLEAGEGGRALVMELVEGPTLLDRVSQGPVPLKEALTIAKQIADALETAHDRGIVHRDLKPANVKLTSDGIVKVLDFGLAKALEAGSAESGAVLATMTSPAMTRAGVILGTAAYMSPEQARGRVVDARTDIWAFGCVVFEMLTGRGPFDGETVTDVLGAIVHRDPEWTMLPSGTPATVRRLLERCLAKDQKQRLHDIADARLELEDLIAAGSRSDVAPAAVSGGGSGRMRPRERAMWAFAGAACVALVAAWVVASGRWPARRSAEARALRLSMLHPDGSEVGVPAISPDGRRVAYRARRADGMPLIWVRDLDRSTPRALSGTEDGRQPFWSPDSQNVGFVVGSVLKRVPADGGPVQEIVRPVGVGATWSPTETILYGLSDGAIQRVSANGGPPTPATILPNRDWSHFWPSFLPDGRHFLFTAKLWTGLAESSAQGIYLGSLDAPSTGRRLLPDLTNGVFVPPGSIAFVRDGRLMTVPFSLETGRVTGEPVSLGESVVEELIFYVAGLSSAADGTLALRPPPAAAGMASHAGGGAFQAELRMVKRDGSVVSTFGGIQWFSGNMTVSPDTRSVVASVQDGRSGSQDLWRFDAQTGARVAMTSMRSTGGYVGQPAWSADGILLAYACQPPGAMDDVCVKDLQTGTDAPLFETKSWEHPLAWSDDGQQLLVAYDDRTASSITELRVWSKRSGELMPYVKRRGTVSDGVFSPDSRFVAYNSLETGRFEVYVTTFPKVRQTWTLTTEGARVLGWSSDGKEIMVATLTGHIAVYPVTTTSGGFTAGAPQVLLRNVGFDAIFARPTRDHSRIVIRVPKDADKDKGEIRLLFGWQKSIQPAVGPK